MSERQTPETDAIRFYLKTRTTYDLTDFEIWENHSAKLERERDEARESLSAAKHYLTKERDDALSQIVQAECRAERFCQERDELREERDIAKLEAEEAAADYQQAVKEINKMREAIIATLEENRHLADGDDCTLAKLKSVVPDWK